MNKQPVHIHEQLLASSEKRLGNYLLDMVAQYALVFLMGLTAGVLQEGFGITGLLDWLTGMTLLQEICLSMTITVLYFMFMESVTQRSIGKYITGTKVVMEDGSKPDAHVIVLRTLCRMIPFEIFSFLGSSPRGWHDSLSKTYVIDVKKYEAEKHLKNSVDEIGNDLPE